MSVKNDLEHLSDCINGFTLKESFYNELLFEHNYSDEILRKLVQESLEVPAKDLPDKLYEIEERYEELGGWF